MAAILFVMAAILFLMTAIVQKYVPYLINPGNLFTMNRVQNPEDPGFLPSLLFLHSCILSSLKMIHPIMPFITEELYHRLPKANIFFL